MSWFSAFFWQSEDRYRLKREDYGMVLVLGPHGDIRDAASDLFRLYFGGGLPIRFAYYDGISTNSGTCERVE